MWGVEIGVLAVRDGELDMGYDEVVPSDVAEGGGRTRRDMDPVGRPWLSGWDKSLKITRYFDL